MLPGSNVSEGCSVGIDLDFTQKSARFTEK